MSVAQIRTELETVDPTEVGLSPERLARIETHLDRRYIEPGKIVGCLTLVARDGRLAWLSCQGLRDRERDLPMSEDTIFRIYSMSKPITSIALMSLYEEGGFQLDDPVAKFIPEFRDLRVYRSGIHPNWLTEPCARPMTVRHLLSHMSGLTYGFMLRTNVDAAYRKLGLGERKGTLREMVEAMADIPLEFSPGERWNYSMATDVCGYLVEVLSGKSFDQFLQERIFDRLGMVDTGFHVPDDKVHRFAANYQRGADKTLGLLDDPQESPYRKPARFLSGGGGLVSTAHDYLPLLSDAPGWGRARRRANPWAENPRADDQQPPSRWQAPHRPRNGLVQRDHLRRPGLWAGLLGRTRPGSRGRWGLAGRVGLGRSSVDGILDRSE